MNDDYKVLLDTRECECPIPTIRLKEKLDSMEADEILKLLADKEGSVKNIRTLVRANAYQLISETKTKEGYVLYIRKGNIVAEEST